MKNFMRCAAFYTLRLHQLIITVFQTANQRAPRRSEGTVESEFVVAFDVCYWWGPFTRGLLGVSR